MAKLRLPEVIALVGAVIMLDSGCPWNGFDDVARRAPVQAIDKPDGFISPQFGKTLIVLHHPDFPRTLVVAGQDTDVLAVLHLDSHGNLGDRTVARVSSADLAGGGDRQTDAVRAMVQIDDDAAGNPRVLVGVPDESYVRVVTLPPDGDPEAAPDQIRTVADASGFVLTSFGGALAAAPLDADLSWDWVIADRDRTFFFFNGDNTQLATCSTPVDSLDPVDGELVVGHFFEEDGNDAVAVVRGAPQAGGAGLVQVIRMTGTAPDCSALLLTPPPAPHQEFFGQSLAAADANGDGVDDLAVGMPADDGSGVVAVYLSEGAPGSRALSASPSFVIKTSETDALSFGRRVAWVDLDGDETPELAVADPTVPYGPNSQGRVHLFDVDWKSSGGTPAESIVGDTSKKETVAGVTLGDSTTSLGLSLTALSWGDSTWTGDELVAGGIGRIMIFFRTTLAGDDSDVADPRF